MEVLQHAALGAAVTCGGLTAAQILLARRLKAPSPLALSLGSFVGVFRFLEGTGRKRSSRNGQPSPTASQAAAIASAVALMLLEAERKTVVVSYAVVEAALTLIKEFTTLAEVKYIDIPVGALAAGPLIDSWIYHSDAIAKSQLAALDSFCQLPSSVLRRMRDELPSEKMVSRCDVFHRGQTCTQFHTNYFIKGMKFAVRLYVPIYAASVLAPKYKRWIWGPRPELRSLLVRYLRTCCCLTMLYQVPLGVSCLSPSARHHATVRVAGALTTLAFLAEHEHRRGNVMKAVGVYATGSVAARSVAALGVPPKAVNLSQLVLLSAAMTVIFQRTTPDSSRMARLLYGYSDQTMSTEDDASATNR
ncbi:hypothetical protein PHMEG_0009916 [Phytophthora megakarya]|uniref:Transmembrane protein 135 N-terminal domain-containing protein n=1 Tax=Phytophthora megakarya TaxID=4795 RepID=A0A225WF05_9STRA|nr:hypothetical protein PHMEG_0009916 [Phytophthora megakarya]